MKFVKLLPFVLLVLASSCVSVEVATDYDRSADFNEYKTYAFYKKGIDKAVISDLDKRRVLKAIEKELAAKGFSKSENPDVLVNIFTKTSNQVKVRNNNFGWGMWNPWFWGAGWNWGWGWGWGAWGPWGLGEQDYQISHTELETLFIDLIDAKKKELAWQGVGTGAIHKAKNATKKDERINTFVSEIMASYPPGTK